MALVLCLPEVFGGAGMGRARPAQFSARASRKTGSLRHEKLLVGIPGCLCRALEEPRPFLALEGVPKAAK